MQIIPAIDLIEGKCVRLTQGNYAAKIIYNENPLEVAFQFEDVGITRLHLVDLDGAKKGEVVNWKVLELLASKTKLIIDFGGGIKNEKALQVVFNSGAAIATLGSIAVKEPQLFYEWIKKYGSDKLLLGADVKDEKLAISGWIEETTISIMDFLKEALKNNLTQAFCTDISKDGMLQGTSNELYKKIIATFPTLHFIASGGVNSLTNLDELKIIGCKGAIVGKALYENKITLNELKNWIKKN